MGNDKYYIKDNNFYDNSSAVKNEYYSNTSHEEILNELAQIKKELNPQNGLYHAISELEIAVQTKEQTKILTTVSKYLKDFVSPFFANVASGMLLNFLKLK